MPLPPPRSEFPLADPVGNRVVLAWFGMSQVLWGSFWDIFSVLLIFCCFNWVVVPLASLAKPEPCLQTALGALPVDSWELKNKGKKPNNDKKPAPVMIKPAPIMTKPTSTFLLSISMCGITIILGHRGVSKWRSMLFPHSHHPDLEKKKKRIIQNFTFSCLPKPTPTPKNGPRKHQ